MIAVFRSEQLAVTLRDEQAGGGGRPSARPVRVRFFDGGDVAHVDAAEVTGGDAHSGLLVTVGGDSGAGVAGLDAAGAMALLEQVGARPLQREAGLLVGFCAPPAPGSPALAPSAFWVKADGSIERCVVQLIPGHAEIFARTRGILETDLLARKRVAIFGLGSGGSLCAVELAKCGVGHFDFVDFDRLELHNVARHCCGVSDLGRYKTRAVRDLVLDKHPGCAVSTHELDVLHAPQAVDAVVAAADVVIAATDNNASRRALNKACLRHGKVSLYGRAMLRACGGDVLRMRPHVGPCYECVMHAVWRGKPEEVSSPRQAEALSYADRPVRPEPGLSNDITPIATMIVKLALHELVRGTGSELESLAEDLSADFYLWANRRQEQYAQWQPMRYRLDGLSVLRWYGTRIDRNPGCPCCGRFELPGPNSGDDLVFFIQA